ncbi:unnamed protein product [Brugia timori]|uniref:Uncharacterized protein n=1 Tax=Brugia timori TaxID=42155 RepID=A0A0R3R920_9BILA|nr:unnamed protein product [Brugia timori]
MKDIFLDTRRSEITMSDSSFISKPDYHYNITPNLSKAIKNINCLT